VTPATLARAPAREETLLGAAIVRLDEAAMHVVALQNVYPDLAEMHQILAALMPAHWLLATLQRLDPAAVDALIGRALAHAQREVGR